MTEKQTQNYLNFIAQKGYSGHTINTYEKAITLFKNFAGSSKTELTTKTAIEFVSSLKCSPRTINTTISALSSFFNYLRNCGEVEENIFQNTTLRAKTPQELPQPLEKEEVNKIFEHLPPKYLTVFRLMLYAGLRISEAIKVKNKDIVIKDDIRWIKVMGKGKKERLTPVLSKKPIEIPENVFTEAQIKSIAWRLAQKCGVNFHCHRLRHTFATNALKKGVRIEQISKWLGHNSINTTLIYAKICDEMSQQAAKEFLNE